MKPILTILICVFLFTGCYKTVQTQFSEAVLKEEYIDLAGNSITFGDILSKYGGKQIVIDVWASWCRDCIVGLPELRALQKEKPDAVYLFLSADRKIETWKRTIKKHNIEGEHYFMPKGTKGRLGDFVDIDWIPRYMIVDATGRIELFEAIEANDPSIKDILK
ncbi:TlpA family protein disulfide reductase [Psychroserpens sp.]|uniref:TlpA family protein disulfide reductase n=1 Tax=Psychroserpens sp. TaxID=2020870 RepID=UPI00385BCC7F